MTRTFVIGGNELNRKTLSPKAILRQPHCMSTLVCQPHPVSGVARGVRVGSYAPSPSTIAPFITKPLSHCMNCLVTVVV